MPKDNQTKPDRCKKRVLLVVRWPAGGIRTFMRYVYQDFDPAEWNLTLLAPDFGGPNVLLEEDLPHLGIEYIPLEKHPSNLKVAARVAQLLFTRHFDLVHSHGFTAGVCTAFSAPLRGCKHLMTSHDMIHAEQFEGSRGTLKKWVIGRLFGTMSRIHLVSHDALKNLISNFGSLRRKKCHVITHGVEVERFAMAGVRDLRTELKLGDEYFLVGYMGRFMSLKGFRYLVDAVEILAQENDLARKPVILCYGWGGFVREEQADIAARGLDEFFRFLPFVPNVAASIKGMDVVVMPSLSEACGLLAMEVLVSGSPLIATNCIGLREVIEDTPATVVPPRDGPALAAAIKAHIQEDCGQKFRDFAPEAGRRFDVKRQVAGILELYRSLTWH